MTVELIVENQRSAHELVWSDRSQKILAGTACWALGLYVGRRDVCVWRRGFPGVHLCVCAFLCVCGGQRCLCLVVGIPRCAFVCVCVSVCMWGAERSGFHISDGVACLCLAAATRKCECASLSL